MDARREDARPGAREREAAARAVEGAVRAHGLRVPSGAAAGLVDYVALLVRWRAARRIAGPSRPEELAVEAVVDALFVSPLVPAAGRMVDVGSGGGLPGIPLAVLEPGRRVTLVEPSRARAGLLRLAAATLGLENVGVRAVRGEAWAAAVERGEEERVEAAISRAFLPPDEWLGLARRLVRPEGVVLVLSGEGWEGPGGGWRVEERVDYRLQGRRRRAAWRLGVVSRRGRFSGRDRRRPGGRRRVGRGCGATDRGGRRGGLRPGCR